MTGGRLMSAFGSGELSYTKRGNPSASDSPPPEYGGMRVRCSL
jgi:hypothetical protein